MARPLARPALLTASRLIGALVFTARGGLFMAWGAVLAACGAAPERSDRQNYVDALRQQDPAACAAVRSPARAAECVALSAHALASAGDTERAWRACGDLPQSPWRDECHFLVTDAASVIGEEARRWCQSAGAFRNQCLGHALNREADQVFDRFARGEEAAALAALTALTSRVVRGGEAEGKAGRLLVDRLVLRDADLPFHAEVCGDAPAALCAEVYVDRVRATQPVPAPQGTDGPPYNETASAMAGATAGGTEPWRAACARTVSPERAASAGMPTWTPEMDPIVQTAWRQICQR
jgi:hypothetical protein